MEFTVVDTIWSRKIVQFSRNLEEKVKNTNCRGAEIYVAFFRFIRNHPQSSMSYLSGLLLDLSAKFYLNAFYPVEKSEIVTELSSLLVEIGSGENPHQNSIPSEIAALWSHFLNRYRQEPDASNEISGSSPSRVETDPFSLAEVSLFADRPEQVMKELQTLESDENGDSSFHKSIPVIIRLLETICQKTAAEIIVHHQIFSPVLPPSFNVKPLLFVFLGIRNAFPFHVSSPQPGSGISNPVIARAQELSTKIEAISIHEHSKEAFSRSERMEIAGNEISGRFLKLKSSIHTPKQFLIEAKSTVEAIQIQSQLLPLPKAEQAAIYANEVFTKYTSLCSAVQTGYLHADGYIDIPDEIFDSLRLFDSVFDAAIFSKKQRNQGKNTVAELYRRQSYSRLQMAANLGLNSGTVSKIKDGTSAKVETEIMQIFESNIQARLEAIRLPSDIAEGRQKAFQDLKVYLAESCPDCNPEIFGSFIMGISTIDGDLDVNLNFLIAIEPQQLIEKLRMIREAFQKNTLLWDEAFVVPALRNPLLTLQHVPSHTSIDITVNKRQNHAKTFIIKTFIALNEKLAPFIILLKDWASRKKLKDASTGTLNSFAYVLLSIFHFQTRPEPALPRLSLPKSEEEATPEKLELIKREAARFTSRNDESIGQLMISFFQKFAFDFDFAQQSASIHEGKAVPKPEKKFWHQRVCVFSCIFSFTICI
eukprot:TRINITY_DN1698_c0_g1_i7.p1 TRINITY_DN1698_c0_g1~~TRINITY_DN1698_c0_g1_i7.p1  ORF type:complete len:705 (+),score=153.35 TRINITY_DN1698_c0_g1_i7:766-2880(+)